AFAAAGADVLYAPGLKTKNDIAAVVRAVAPKPVNVVMGREGAPFSLVEVGEPGVKRWSIGSALARAAYGAALRAATEIRDAGTFSFADEAVPFATLNAMSQPPR